MPVGKPGKFSTSLVMRELTARFQPFHDKGFQ